MNKQWILDCYNEDVDGIRQLLDVLAGMYELWQAQPQGHFGPGEQFVHIIQSGHFATRFIREQLGIDPATELEPYFQRAAFNHDELTKLNLRGAREVCSDFATFNNFRGWVFVEIGRIRAKIEGIDELLYSRLVSHPLVHMVGPTGEILAKMFARHWPYHLGQFTEAIKWADFRERVPFLPHFGLFGEQPAAAALSKTY